MVFDSVDIDGNGFIDFNEFIYCLVNEHGENEGDWNNDININEWNMI